MGIGGLVSMNAVAIFYNSNDTTYIQEIKVDGRFTEQSFKDYVSWGLSWVKWTHCYVKLRGTTRKVFNANT